MEGKEALSPWLTETHLERVDLVLVSEDRLWVSLYDVVMIKTLVDLAISNSAIS